jgi:hypothetical protein
LQQQLNEIEDRRKARIERVARANEEAFRPLVKFHDRLTWTSPPYDQCNPVFSLHGNASLLTIFLRIFAPDFVARIIESVPPERLILEKKHIKTINLNHKLIYGTLAIMIRIQGIHKPPQWNTRNNRPLRDAVVEARNHFNTLSPVFRNFSVNRILRVIALGMLNMNISEDLSLQFQNLLTYIGEPPPEMRSGNSGDIRMVL